MRADTKAGLRSEIQTLIAALKKHCAKQKFVINGKVVHVADITNDYEEQLKLLDQSNASRAKWQYDLKQSRAENAAMKPTSKSLQTFVANQFGLDSPIFLEFGFKPRKVTKKSAITKANAVVKQTATRKAHHPAPPTPLLNGTSNGAPHA